MESQSKFLLRSDAYRLSFAYVFNTHRLTSTESFASDSTARTLRARAFSGSLSTTSGRLSAIQFTTTLKEVTGATRNDHSYTLCHVFLIHFVFVDQSVEHFSLPWFVLQ